MVAVIVDVAGGIELLIVVSVLNCLSVRWLLIAVACLLVGPGILG